MGILFVLVIRSGYLHAPLPARESTHKTQLDSLDGTGAKSTSIQQNATAFNNWQELPVDCWLFEFTKQKDTVRNFFPESGDESQNAGRNEWRRNSDWQSPKYLARATPCNQHGKPRRRSRSNSRILYNLFVS